jgi:uncharacterized protein
MAGLLSGLLGIGGGLVVSPALVLRGLPIRRAMGTALAVVLPVACVAVLTELVLASEQLHGWLALAIALGGQLGAPVGARVLRFLPEAALRAAFIGLLLYAATRNLGLLGDLPGVANQAWQITGTSRYLAALGLGVLAGVCAVLFGVGGGVVVVPGLVLILGGLPIREAMATSLLAMIPTAAAGLRIAWRDGRVEGPTLRGLFVPALGGAVLGVSLRNFALEPTHLAQAFGVFLLYVAWRLRPSGGSPGPRSPSKS